MLEIVLPYLPYLKAACVVVSVILIGRMIATYRKVRPVSKRTCLIGIVFPLLILTVNAVIIGTSLPTAALVGLGAAGLVLGLVRGQKSRLWLENNRPRVQYTVWFLVVWGISYCTIQILVSLGHSLSLNLGIGSMCFSTAIALGSQSNILVRLGRLKPVPAPMVSSGAAVLHPSETSAVIPPVLRSCRECGGVVRQGDRYCRSCRIPLA